MTRRPLRFVPSLIVVLCLLHGVADAARVPMYGALHATCLAAETSDAIVRIGGCSGVCVDAEGIVLTAKHCRLDETEAVHFPGHEPVEGRRVYVGPDAEDAVAFVVPGDGWASIPVADAVPTSGADVWTAGYPSKAGRQLRTARGKLLGGAEHELLRNGVSQGRFLANETTLVAGPGWSGGPLISARGRTIGLLSSGDATGSTFISWASTRRAFEAAREALQGKPHLLVFGYQDCPYCRAFLADLAAGRFASYEVEYVDVQTPAGRKRYDDLRAALHKATGTQQPGGFPAFHVAGRAAMTVGYGQRGGDRLLTWVRETLRLPVTGLDAITGRADGGVSPDPGIDLGEEGDFGDLGRGTSPAPTPNAPTSNPPTPTTPTFPPPPTEEPLPLWAMIAGSVARLLEQRFLQRRAA